MQARPILSFAGLVTLVACAAPPHVASPAAGPAAPVVAPVAVAPVLASATSVTASLGSTSLARAAVQLVAPKAAYGVLADPAQHWVAADILEYVVELERQKTAAVAAVAAAPGIDAVTAAPATYDAANGITVTLPLKGDNVKTLAVFTNVPWGSSYRAFVSALGNHGGIVNVTVAGSSLLPMNTLPGTADFDFTTPSSQGATLTEPAQVVFDSVIFAGQGTVSFASPADGVFIPPVPIATGTAE